MTDNKNLTYLNNLMKLSEYSTECRICYNDLTETNKALYNTFDNSEWLPIDVCSDCILLLQKSGWSTYISKIKSADCNASLKRLLKNGPPTNILLRDLIITNITNITNIKEENNTEVDNLYINGEIISAKLEGSLVGLERDKWIEEQHNCLICME
jgi:hypothetical protein